MKQPTFNGRVLLPMDIIEAARAGDPLALERVLRYYDRYINKICTRTLYGKDGLPRIGIDEYMKHRLQAKLVDAIVVKK
ncbi:helix-turn-helix domain-containing protein [Intestinimonas sp. UBA1698]|uniref:helix-turn-helix domain-containing protein n=1 Tax=Intestinimonas sp. UBA1698 TaxID=1946651 RepID=UPI00257BC2DA|nr:helix-turn-helix domain-containing protein [Intestinimonas sp. UBA1698]